MAPVATLASSGGNPPTVEAEERDPGQAGLPSEQCIDPAAGIGTPSLTLGNQPSCYCWLKVVGPETQVLAAYLVVLYHCTVHVGFKPC